jgi:hypothetical protein
MIKKLYGGEFATNNFFNFDKKLKFLKTGTFTLCGRHALEIVLKNIKNLNNKSIYIPSYNCPSIELVVNKYFKKIILYDLNKNLSPKIKKIKKNSIFLLVNYFGKENKFLQRKDTIIIKDLSHSLLNTFKLKKNILYFASLRKFGIFNLGGWTNVNSELKSKNERVVYFENYRLEKFKYFNNNIRRNNKFELKLLKSLKKEENKIFNLNTIIKQNQLKKITSISSEKIKLKRIKNYLYLKKNIQKNFLNIDYKKNEVPFCFFVKFNTKKQRDKAQKKLSQDGIFCPVYWRIFSEKKRSRINFLSNNYLAIPIDHRINFQGLKYIVKKINNL